MSFEEWLMQEKDVTPEDLSAVELDYAYDEYTDQVL
jgi:hypothetical protein